MMNEQYKKYCKFHNNLKPEQRGEVLKKARKYASKHNKGTIED